MPPKTPTKKYKYATTFGDFAHFHKQDDGDMSYELVMDRAPDVPKEPDGVEDWEMIGSVATTARFYWFWRRLL